MGSKVDRCIYCESHGTLTHSHIIPEGLGSKLKLPSSVCRECNVFLGRTIEAKICADLSFYRFLAQIETKKGKDVTTKAELEVMGNKISVQINRAGIPKLIPPIIFEKESSRKFLVLGESPEKLRKNMMQFEKMGIHFETDDAIPHDVRLIATADKRYISSDEYLRVVSKIAFEYLCYFSPQRTFNPEYGRVKNYIRNGQYKERRPAKLIFEFALVNRILPLPFPLHGILLFGHENVVASIVIIFGLFYYFIILSDSSPGIQDWEEFAYFIPKTKEHIRATLIKRSYPLSLILRLIKKSLRDQNVERKVQEFSKQKLDSFLKDMDSKKSRKQIGYTILNEN